MFFPPVDIWRYVLFHIVFKSFIQLYLASYIKDFGHPSILYGDEAFAYPLVRLTLGAEVKDAIKKLEQKWEATPSALEECLTESIGKLTGQVETVEQMINALTNSVTVSHGRFRA